MIKIILPTREILKETILNKGFVGKIDFNCIIEKVQLNLNVDLNLLKGERLVKLHRDQFFKEENIKLFKKTIRSLDNHYCLVVENPDNFTYVATFTKSMVKAFDTSMGQYKFIHKVIAAGQENISGSDKFPQYLVVDPIYQFEPAWIKICQDERVQKDNAKAAEYWEKHCEEIADAIFPSFNDPTTKFLQPIEVISNANEVMLKIIS